MLCGGEQCFSFLSLSLLSIAALVDVAHSYSLIYSLKSSKFGPTLEATIEGLQNSFSNWLYLLALWQGRRLRAKQLRNFMRSYCPSRVFLLFRYCYHWLGHCQITVGLAFMFYSSGKKLLETCQQN